MTKSEQGPTPLGVRIKERAKALKVGFAEIERDIGVAKDHIWDVARGKKRSLTMPVLERLAARLETTAIWLLHGKDAAQQQKPASCLERVKRVAASREEMARISSIDIETGSCALHIGGERISGVIVDPALRVEHNRYIAGMSAMRPIPVLLKDVTLLDNSMIAVVLDAKEK